jgi:hypothetical protein
VIPVRLVLFCEMIKARPWTPDTYRAVGGASGAGVMYFEETFVSRMASPQHRMHQKAAQAFLEALLLGADSDLERRVLSTDELRRICGYENRPTDFVELLRILDHELRIITPSDPVSQSDEHHTTTPPSTYYQLSHDYLGSVLRQWLENRRRQSHRGRAQLLLEEWVRMWRPQQRPRHVMGIGDYAYIRLLTPRSSWSPTQRAVLQAARRKHARRTAGGIVLLLALLIAVGVVRRHDHTRRVVQGVLRTTVEQLTEYVELNRSALRRGVSLLLNEMRTAASQDKKLNAALVVAWLGDPHARDEAERALLPMLWSVNIDASQYASISDVLEMAYLGDNRKYLIEHLLGSLQDDSTVQQPHLRCAALLSRLCPTHEFLRAHSAQVGAELTSLPRSQILERWQAATAPVADLYVDRLLKILRCNTSVDSKQYDAAWHTLIQFGSDDPDILLAMLRLCECNDTDVDDIVSRLVVLGAKAESTLRRNWKVPQRPEGGHVEVVHVAIALTKLGSWDAVWELLAAEEANPTKANLMVHELARHQCDPIPLAVIQSRRLCGAEIRCG